MSQVLINQYLAQLDVLKKVGGTHRESVVREAFKDLLKGWGRQHDLVFIPEYKLDSATRDTRFVDGALLHELRVPFGYWEAKDAKDDLDAEIAFKFGRGYPQDNIVFEDSTQAVLIQHRAEVMRCDVTDVKALEKLLKLFFAYERAEIADFRQAVAQFKTDLPAVLEALRAMIEAQHAGNAAFRDASAAFLKHAQEAINPGLSAADVREMLIQHILTEEIFSKVFDSEFHRDNNVAKKLYELEATFFTGGLKRSTLKGLEAYYAAIRAAAAQIGSHAEKQTFLKVIYENFYKVYNAKAADRLGVVYTPGEIVRFMIEGADWLCEKHFGRNLIDKNVEILDPATGTGTFVCELLEHFRGQPAKLRHKYAEELHANEVAILPYYVANLNIEATYAAITGEYAEFKNLCFVDTLDNVGLHTAAAGVTHDLFGSVSEENVARIKRQNGRRISVVIGNPPYNANQANENDNNKNREYPQIDARIKQTYIAESTAQKTKLYDMYARFFRWASDRLAADGVLAFVTSRTFDGFRKTVAQEFAEAYVVDLGGDVRANPKLSGTKHNVFGIQTGVAISFFIKRHAAAGKTKKDKAPCRVFYARRPELETAEEKLAWLGSARAAELAFEEVRPDGKGNWLNLTSNDFDELMPLVESAAKAHAVFALTTNGVNTARDDWVYDFDPKALQKRMAFAVDEFNKEHMRVRGIKLKELDREALSKRLKWSEGLINNVVRQQAPPVADGPIVSAHYRPFVSMRYYGEPTFSDRLTEKHADLFGKNLTAVNQCVAISAPGNAATFRLLASSVLCDWHFMGDTRLYALYRYQDGIRLDNITDWALKQFQQHYEAGAGKAKKGGSVITKEAIFHYVYAVLHDPVYRDTYAQNLKREFPRIPLYGSEPAAFRQWAGWGAELMAQHLGYEQAEPLPLARSDTPDAKARAAGLAPKCILKSEPEAGRIVIDSETVLAGIPRAAWDYRLGNRSALDWVLDQHKEKKPKDPTIRARFDTYRLKDHKERVIDLLARVAAVSMETVRIVGAMKAEPR
ncbi:MAG TPA: type ISP restriction/modification enzyme [Methylibium sp.]|nr:type ISP restriction/modification enzyme [Methylibium sp.]